MRNAQESNTAHVEVVLGEALHVHGQKLRQPRELVAPPPKLDVVVHPLAIILVQDLKDGHLCSVRTAEQYEYALSNRYSIH